VEELPDHLRVHWPRLRGDLLAGGYQPQPVKEGGDPEARGGASVSSASRPCSTGSSNRPCCRSCNRGSTQPSRMQATASGPDGVRRARCVVHNPKCRKAAASSWTSTWRSSSTGSTTTS